MLMLFFFFVLLSYPSITSGAARAPGVGAGAAAGSAGAGEASGVRKSEVKSACEVHGRGGAAGSADRALSDDLAKLHITGATGPGSAAAMADAAEPKAAEAGESATSREIKKYLSPAKLSQLISDALWKLDGVLMKNPSYITLLQNDLMLVAEDLRERKANRRFQRKDPVFAYFRPPDCLAKDVGHVKRFKLIFQEWWKGVAYAIYESNAGHSASLAVVKAWFTERYGDITALEAEHESGMIEIFVTATLEYFNEGKPKHPKPKSKCVIS